jgi:NAD(P)-dependent dehydrogenase (short-subunit alcohol dehydrogenase family)
MRLTFFLSRDQWAHTFNTNIHAYFFLSKYALPHLQSGDTIINTTSVTAYAGTGPDLDYISTKGAIVAFTRGLSSELANKGIRVNGVAPGPVWTPLVVSTMSREELAQFSSTPMGRPGQPSEIATCYVFLASQDSSFISGQVLHPNGGTIVNG